VANAGSGRVFDIEERLKELSAKGDELERLNAVVNFELFRAGLERAVPRSDRSRVGGTIAPFSSADQRGRR
jgi:IS5 family transposase